PGSVVEDTVNKPWRPIPASRITPYEAQRVLRVAVPAAMGLSAILGSFVASVTLMAFIWLYNDLEGSGAGPWQRNVLNAAGLLCFGWGAVLVLLGGDDLLNDVLCKWLMLLAAVIITTVQAQDLPDVGGDSAYGRKIMPTLYGQAWSRYGLAVLLLLWSVVCPAFWHVSSLLVWVATLLIGSTMTALTTLRWDPFFDLIVWRFWCLWISVLYLLSLYGQA
ncbi:UbiA prenyltransferase family, partial [Halenospora varia]